MVQIKNKEELKKTNSPVLRADYNDLADNNARLEEAKKQAKNVSEDAKKGVEPAQSQEAKKVKDVAESEISNTVSTGNKGSTKFNEIESQNTANTEIGNSKDSDGKKDQQQKDQQKQQQKDNKKENASNKDVFK